MDPATTRASLTRSGRITTEADGQLIEGLMIDAEGHDPAIQIDGHARVVIRHCLIHHADGQGINAEGASELLIEDCQIICTSAPASGPLATFEALNVRLDGCSAVAIRRLKVERGASGIYAHRCTNIRIGKLEGHDFRGPFPRGQLVQFDKCREALLEDFSCENNGNTSWSEDNVNCFGCVDPIIRRGFIHGNNSPSGIGVLIENGEGGGGGLVQDVDVVYWANGAFSAAENSSGVVFERCRARDGLGPAASSTNLGRIDYRGQPIPSLETWMSGQNRGTPLSGQEAFFAYETGEADIVFRDCSYANLPKAPNLAWDQERMTVAEFEEVDFTPRTSLRLAFPWSVAAASPEGNEHPGSGSRIDPTKPIDGAAASKADLRANLQAAKDEIEALQRGTVAWKIVRTDYRLEPGDVGGMILVDSPDEVIVTCPEVSHAGNGLSHPIKVVRWGAGSVRFAPEGDLVLSSPGGRLTIPERHGTATLHILDRKTVLLEGV